MKRALLLLMLAVGLPASAQAFDPALDAGDHDFLRYLLAELPGELLSRDPARIHAVESRVASYALEERARERADLELAVGRSFWSNGAAEARWMIRSSLAMLAGLERAGKAADEIAPLKAALLAKQALVARTESSLDVNDPANVPKLVPVLGSLLNGDGHKLSEIYLRLRALYVPLRLAPALEPLPLFHQLLPGLDGARWDSVMSSVENEILASRAAEQLPASARASFVKSALDLFFTYKFPLLDLGYGAILDPLRPNPGTRPDAGAAEALSSLRSLERVLQAADAFARIDRAGGGLAWLRSIQPLASAEGSLCSRLQLLTGFSPADWQRVRSSSKRILLDPGHLGGEFADDARDVSPPGEKGQESYGYREGHDTFVVANLARLLLTRCAGLPPANVLLTRHALHDEGGFWFDKAGRVVSAEPSPSNRVSDNLYFRKVMVAAAEPDFVISMHTDWSDTQTQHGLIVVPHATNGLEQGFYKSRVEYAGSIALATALQRALGESMYSAAGAGGKSAHDFLGFEFPRYYFKEMDLQIFRDLRATPVALVEGYDYASPAVRALMNGVARGHLRDDPDVRPLTIDGAAFWYHTVHRAYAEGVAAAALRFLLAP